VATLRETLRVTPSADHFVERAGDRQGHGYEQEASEQRAGGSHYSHQ
jgi:hypothetical protein